MSEKKHLWEVEHSYYCNEGNYFAKEQPFSSFKSWSEFMDEEGDSDFDMNLVFRWDWNEHNGDGEGCNYAGDDNYRNGELLIFFMGQRKGLYRWASISVCRADEPSVIAYLKPRWEHLCCMWEPIQQATTGETK